MKKAEKQSCCDQLQQLSVTNDRMQIRFGLACSMLTFVRRKNTWITFDFQKHSNVEAKTFKIFQLNFMRDYPFILPSVKF